MQSPWQTGFHDQREDYDLRSTSAPPPETSFLFGGGTPGSTRRRQDGLDSILGSSFVGSEDQLQQLSPYDVRELTTTPDALFAASSHSTGNRRSPAPPGFGAADFLAPSSSSLEYRNGSKPSPGIQCRFPETSSSGFLGSLDRQFIGENLGRSQSAAPAFDGGFSMGPPPGLARRETPLVSNRSSRMPGSVTMESHHRDSYLEMPMDRSHILQLGQRRPASTGVIGGSSQTSSSAVLSSLGLGTGSGAVRPAAKTLMDLIQEDFPPETPTLDDGDFYGNDFQRESAFALERPRTTSPLSSPYNSLRSEQHYLYPGRDDGELLGSVDGFRLNNGVGAALPFQNGSMERTRPSPHYAVVDRNGVSGTGVGMYAPIPSHPQVTRAPQSMPNVQHQETHHLRYEQTSNGNFNGHGQQHPQPVQHQVHAQVLPSGHTVYVNAPSPTQYQQYATIQYNPQTGQHQILHQIPSGGISRHANEQYISVVPIQSNGQIQSGGPGGTYTYWQPPDGQSGGTHAVAILPPGAGGLPVAVPQMGGSPAGTPTSQKQHRNQNQHQQRNNSQGGRGKEKNGKGRRNGGATPGRKGGAVEGKGQPTSNGHSHHVSLLDEFKNKKNNREWTIIDIKENVVEFCKDQNGSRFVQQRLEVGVDDEKEIVASEVLPVIDQLRNDVFGNYVVQKLLDFGTDKMKHALRGTLSGEMVPLSMQMYGCRVVQKALERMSDTDLEELLDELQHNVLNLIHDQNGNHVIQKCIEVFYEKSKHSTEPSKSSYYNDLIDFIVDDVLHNIASLSCHPYGCRVLQRILEFCPEPKKGVALDEIRKSNKKLLDDQYGNYVIQHVLQFGRVEDRDMVLEMVAENGLLKLSRQKFASNVVEKLLKYGNGEQRKAVVRQMLRLVDEKTGNYVEDGEHGTTVVLLMVRDAYANYVVQTTLDVVPESEEKSNLLKELTAHSTELKNYTFAKHILTKIA